MSNYSRSITQTALFFIKYKLKTRESNKKMATSWCSCAIHSKIFHLPALISILVNTVYTPNAVCNKTKTKGNQRVDENKTDLRILYALIVHIK
jgi:hypothetical protein